MRRGGWCGCLGRREKGGEGGRVLGRMTCWGGLGEWILRVGMGREGRGEGWREDRSVWGKRGRGGRREGWGRGSDKDVWEVRHKRAPGCRGPNGREKLGEEH